MTTKKPALNVSPLVLPTVDDISMDAAYLNIHRRLIRLRGYVESTRVVWWRREGFHKEPFRDVEPKWHIFVSRTHAPDADSRWDFLWRAACGYTHVRSEIIFGLLEFKVTAPRRDNRCEKCHAMFGAFLQANSRMGPS